MEEPIQPRIAQKTPFKVEVEAGKTYAWCSCGWSAKQPYCDGSHQGTGFRPVLQTFEQNTSVAWCGCKRSAKGCFCDGTHRTL